MLANKKSKDNLFSLTTPETIFVHTLVNFQLVTPHLLRLARHVSKSSAELLHVLNCALFKGLQVRAPFALRIALIHGLDAGKAPLFDE